MLRKQRFIPEATTLEHTTNASPHPSAYIVRLPSVPEQSSFGEPNRDHEIMHMILIYKFMCVHVITTEMYTSRSDCEGGRLMCSRVCFQLSPLLSFVFSATCSFPTSGTIVRKPPQLVQLF